MTKNKNDKKTANSNSFEGSFREGKKGQEGSCKANGKWLELIGAGIGFALVILALRS